MGLERATWACSTAVALCCTASRAAFSAMSLACCAVRSARARTVSATTTPPTTTTAQQRPKAGDPM
ncbi:MULTISPECIES: hypothetical protein [unclassified Nonomuraea]|uniref:hypothetical protein n=1 Tax=unclassified Nonomuraea TaxID=2593643 RepID=UPI0010FD32CD|nr:MULTISPECIES: hypothetical protein [unclassified Nonomuraea]NBE97235.1 hypothetical protein [Nonomuraea sp. K271]